MIAFWMIYSVLVGGLVSIAALATERAFLLVGRPVRHVWAAALALSLLIPCLGRFLPRSAAVPPLVQRAMLRTADLMAPRKLLAVPSSVDAPTTGFPYTKALLIGWGLTSLGLAQLILYSMAVLQGRRRGWRPMVIDGVVALVAPDFGPAVIGWRRLEIVLPAWVMELAPDARALVVRHEQEHVRRRDPRLLIHASLALLTMPWNPALWWQYRRLRRAIELDCDARVVRGGASVARYGEVLLEAGSLSVREKLPAFAAFAERAGDLEARIKALTPGRGSWRAARTSAAIVTAGLTVGAAVMVPDPLAQKTKYPTASGQELRPTLPSDPADLAAWARAALQGVFTTNKDVLMFRSHEGKFLGSRFLRLGLGSLSRDALGFPVDFIESMAVLKGPRAAIPNVLSALVITLKSGRELPEGMDDSFRRYVLCSSGMQPSAGDGRPTSASQPRDPTCF